MCAGVTQWEIYTYGAKPYEEMRAKDMQAFLAQGRRLDQPSICTVDVFSVVVLCWLPEPASRPNFRELVERFARFFRDPPKYFWVEVSAAALHCIRSRMYLCKYSYRLLDT